MAAGDNQDLPEEVNVGDVEELLDDLAGVQACRVVCNQWGAVEEIHILAADDRHPKQIVRDIESALAAKWGLQVDHKKISVAQVEHREPVRSSDGRRVSLVSINTVNRPGKMQVETCVVIRSPDNRDVEGRAISVLSPAQYGRVSAEAAVRAVTETMDDGCSVHLEDMRVLPMTAGSVVVCQLSVLRSRGDAEIIAGVSPVWGEDLIRAAVDAVLAAANSLDVM
ncbi:MAG: hypothetical protein R6U70_03040 [Bacillota bacterium]